MSGHTVDIHVDLTFVLLSRPMTTTEKPFRGASTRAGFPAGPSVLSPSMEEEEERGGAMIFSNARFLGLYLYFCLYARYISIMT